MRALATVAVLAGVALAGCGGDGGDSEPPTAREVASCVRDGGAEATTDRDDLDAVASAAGVGGVDVEWPRNSATVVIERTDSDAENTERTYELFAEGFETDLGDTLRRDGTVVVLYDKSPTDDEAALIEDCTG
jgi:predicted small lipoprotein YifL